MTHHYYWVIWYPTLIHREFTPISDKITADKITDLGKIPFFLTVELCDKGNTASDIELFFSRNESESENIAKIRLNYLAHSSNGLFLYQCIYNPENGLENKIAKNPKHAIIHTLKKLFHKHTFHGFSDINTEKDFFSKAKIIDINTRNGIAESVKINQIIRTNINQIIQSNTLDKDNKKDKINGILKQYLKSENNDFILHYLDEFNRIYYTHMGHFKDLKCDIKSIDKAIFQNAINNLNQSIVKTCNFLDYYKSLDVNKKKDYRQLADFAYEAYLGFTKRVKKYEQRLRIIQWISFSSRFKLFYNGHIARFNIKINYRKQLHDDACLVVGETLFTNSLTHSKYLNSSIIETKDNEEIKQRKDKVRKLSLNIENLKECLHYIEDEHKDVLNNNWNTKSLKWTVIGIIIGVLVTLLSSRYTHF
jgi:hypothetical protein